MNNYYFENSESANLTKNHYFKGKNLAVSGKVEDKHTPQPNNNTTLNSRSAQGGI